METLEQLQAIIDNAPSGSTHISDNGVFYRLDGYTPLTWWVRGREWIDTGVHHITRSLSDIKRIIELEKELAGVILNFNSGVKCSDIPDNLAM